MDVYAASFDIKAAFPPAAFNDLGSLMTVIVQLLISIAGILAIIFIIVAGFNLITASGDEKKIASAKGTLTYAIVGLIALILTFAVLRIVQYFLKANLEIF